MKRAFAPAPDLGLPPTELRAQRLACSYLVRACREALVRVTVARVEAGSVEEQAASARAVEIVDGVLADWVEALQLLQAASGRAEQGSQSTRTLRTKPGNPGETRRPASLRGVLAL